MIAAYAHAHNFTLVRTYKDDGESGLLIKNRTRLLRLLEDVVTNQADSGHLLVYDVSQWGASRTLTKARTMSSFADAQASRSATVPSSSRTTGACSHFRRGAP
ncbi:hypothetical protein [Bradyrhizobium sp. USDA 4459]